MSFVNKKNFSQILYILSFFLLSVFVFLEHIDWLRGLKNASLYLALFLALFYAFLNFKISLNNIFENYKTAKVGLMFASAFIACVFVVSSFAYDENYPSLFRAFRHFGRAIAFLCAQKGAGRVTILNRSVDKACSVAEEVKEKTGYQAIHARSIAEAGRLDGRDYLAIQATSVGLFPDSEKAAVEDSAFYEKVSTGYDLIYRPAETKFMRLVKENGKEAYNGLKMLLYQGVEAFELWNDVAVSKETADRIYQRMEQELSGK